MSILVRLRGFIDELTCTCDLGLQCGNCSLQGTDRCQRKALKTKVSELYLQRVQGYRNPERYWSKRWKLIPGRTWTPKKDIERILCIMAQYQCTSVLEVGCGLDPCVGLPGYVACDFSRTVTRKLSFVVQADLTDKLPFADKSFDCFLSRYVLLHIPHEKIETAVRELIRVTRKLGIIQEPSSFKETQPHCFSHDLPALFHGFPLERI